MQDPAWHPPGMTNLPLHHRVTSLSGNEIYCLHQIGMQPGQLCVGNSVMALGVGRAVGAGLATLGGGEVEAVTRLVHQARQQAFDRLSKEAQADGGQGITGVTFEVVNHGNNLEFTTLGSTVHGGDRAAAQFSTSGDAQQLFCQVDAGFAPLAFVFGNVAYSIGVGGNLMGRLSSLRRGEIPQFSDIFDKTRHLAIQRISAEGKKRGANAIVGIRTTITPLLGTQEMVMIGTASHHPLLGSAGGDPVTSDMTPEEQWNMAHLGYMPQRLVMGVSVYSLGLVASLGSALGSLVGGELSGLTEMLYEARSKALARIDREAAACGADQVVGVKVRVYDMGFGLVEFMAIGTAVKKIPGMATRSQNLPPQAIIQDRETLVDTTQGVSLSRASRASAGRTQRGPLTFILSALFAVLYILLRLYAKK
jgi:uncharacterized protein YbjQ (UPF0145 family)